MSDPPLYLPPRATGAHKGEFGKVLLVGGSRGMSGAVALSAIAALRCGSGLVTAAVPDRCLETVASYHPGVMTIALADDAAGRFALQATEQLAARVGNFDAIGVGPGMTTQPGSVRMIERLLEASLPRVLDADAINCLAELGQIQQQSLDRIVLTPHPGEFQRISGISARERGEQIDAAESIAGQTGAVIVLKGGPTVVIGSTDSSTPISTWTNSTGNPGMATAGSGDVLTGVITSLLGQGLSTWDAARLGVWVHGLAGDLAANTWGRAGTVCTDIAESIGKAIQAAVASKP